MVIFIYIDGPVGYFEGLYVMFYREGMRDTGVKFTREVWEYSQILRKFKVM